MRWRLVLVFTPLGAFAAAAMIPYQLETGQLQALLEQQGISVHTALSLQVVQTAVLCLLASWLGLTLAARTGLQVPFMQAWLSGRKAEVSVKWLGIAVIGSILGTLLVVLLDLFVFQPRLQLPETAVEVSVWKKALLLFYGGIVEEVLVRLGLMTFVVWLLSIGLRKRGRPIPGGVYWAAILAATLLFGLGHLPVTAALFGGLTPLLVVRAVALNGLLGVFWGYLYWRKGLEYAIVSHMCADLFLHVIWAGLLA